MFSSQIIIFTAKNKILFYTWKLMLQLFRPLNILCLDIPDNRERRLKNVVYKTLNNYQT